MGIFVAGLATAATFGIVGLALDHADVVPMGDGHAQVALAEVDGDAGDVVIVKAASAKPTLDVSELAKMTPQQAAEKTLELFDRTETIDKADFIHILKHLRAEHGLPPIPDAVLNFVY
jgi:hypothetical protein